MKTEHEKQMCLFKIGSEFAEGKPHSSVCPFCGNSSLVLSFTTMGPPFYGVFIVCRECGKGEHLTLSGKPLGFRDDLVLPEFQKLENDAMKNT